MFCACRKDYLLAALRRHSRGNLTYATLVGAYGSTHVPLRNQRQRYLLYCAMALPPFHGCTSDITPRRKSPFRCAGYVTMYPTI